jgi:hypothetical protein
LFGGGDTTKQVVAEADLAVILAKGRWTVGECKTTALGLQEPDLAKLWDFAERVDAPATFVATLDPSANCGEIWQRTTNPQDDHILPSPPSTSTTSTRPTRWAKTPSAGEPTIEPRDTTVESVVQAFTAYLKNTDTDNFTWQRAPWTIPD